MFIKSVPIQNHMNVFSDTDVINRSLFLLPFKPVKFDGFNPNVIKLRI